MTKKEFVEATKATHRQVKYAREKGLIFPVMDATGFFHYREDEVEKMREYVNREKWSYFEPEKSFSKLFIENIFKYENRR